MNSQVRSIFMAAGIFLCNPLYSLETSQVLRGSIGLEAGSYEFESYDRTEALKLIGDRQAQDKDYVIQVVNEIEASFADLIETELMGETGLYTLSDLSRGSSTPVTLEQYFGSKRQYLAAKMRLQNKIQSLTALPSLLAKGQHSEGELQIPQFIQIEFAPITDYYSEELVEIEQATQQLQFLLQLPNQSIQTVTGLNFSIAHPYTAEQLTQMRKKAAQLRTLSGEDLRLIDTLNRQTLDRVLAFIDSFGISQRYRKKRNISERQQVLARELQDAFFARSLLRSVYGIPLGTLGIRYKKRVLDIDLFRNKNQITFLSEPVRGDADMIRIKDQLYYAIKAAESRSGKKDSKSLVDYASNFSTFFKGEVQMAEVNLLMLNLLASDMEEEMILGKAGGLREMRAKYRRDYYTSKEAEERTKLMADNFFGDSDEDDIEADVGFIDAGTLVGVFRTAQVALENQYDRNNEAEAIEATLSELTQGNSGRKKAKKRRRI